MAVTLEGAGELMEMLAGPADFEAIQQQDGVVGDRIRFCIHAMPSSWYISQHLREGA